MENNELEEMRAQLATLNEKLDNESIVDERLVSEATKKHVSELQRKLIGRIVLITAWAVFFYWKLELGIFLLWCVGLLVISIYMYLVVRKGNSASMPVTEYARRLRKALKIYKIGNRFLWILTILLILAWATYVLVLNWPSNLEQVLTVFFVCSMIALILLAAYFIRNVYVSPEVELKLEMVLEDLGKDNQDAE
jgi:magnesium-transporting ATPase (P-type)